MSLKQKITIVNSVRKTSHTLLLERTTGRLSRRQERETFQALSVPGFHKAGLLGEWPLNQKPPEHPETEYCVIRMGEAEGSNSNIYFVPASSAAHLIKTKEAERPVAVGA